MKNALSRNPKNQSPAGADFPALSWREFLRQAGAAAAGTILSACTPFQASPAPQGGDQVQLVYQDWRTCWFPPIAQEMLEQFQAIHPNIRVFYTPDPEDVQEKMLADFQGGTAPDVFQGCCTHFPAWAQMGYMLDLCPCVGADLDQEIMTTGTRRSTARSSRRMGNTLACPSTTVCWRYTTARIFSMNTVWIIRRHRGPRRLPGGHEAPHL